MIRESLARALVLLRECPLLWLPGLAAGALGALDLVLQFWLGTSTAMRLWFLELVILPFFTAASYASVHTGECGASSYLQGGARYYFRVMLPTLVIGFATVLTILLLTIPLTFMGIAATTLPLILAGTVVPIIFFTFFYDTAAVFEDAKVFESIRRSVEVVLRRAGQVILFYLACFVILAAIAIPLALAWTSILYDRILPLASLNTTDIQALSSVSISSMLGFDGLVFTAVMFVIAVTAAVSLLLAFKAAFYQQISGEAVPVLQGEYDEKGRWYKY
jgi:hypothetical protein